jgi:hypothetical protein
MGFTRSMFELLQGLTLPVPRMVQWSYMVPLGPWMTLLGPLGPPLVIWAPNKIMGPHIMGFTRSMFELLQGLTLPVPRMVQWSYMVPLGPWMTLLGPLGPPLVIWAPNKIVGPHIMGFTRSISELLQGSTLPVPRMVQWCIATVQIIFMN